MAGLAGALTPASGSRIGEDGEMYFPVVPRFTPLGLAAGPPKTLKLAPVPVVVEPVAAHLTRAARAGMGEVADLLLNAVELLELICMLCARH